MTEKLDGLSLVFSLAERFTNAFFQDLYRLSVRKTIANFCNER